MSATLRSMVFMILYSRLRSSKLHFRQALSWQMSTAMCTSLCKYTSYVSVLYMCGILGLRTRLKPIERPSIKSVPHWHKLQLVCGYTHVDYGTFQKYDFGRPIGRVKYVFWERLFDLLHVCCKTKKKKKYTTFAHLLRSCF